MDELKGLRHCFIIYEKSYYCEQGTRMKYLLFFLFLFLSLLESRFFGKQKSNIFQLRAFQKKKEKTTTNSPLFSFGEVISPSWEAPVSSLDYPATETRHG